MKKLIFFSVLLVVWACSPDKGIPRGEIAPEISAQDIDGNPVSLKDLKGKTVMLYFWADWCPACKKEFPATQEYYKKLKGEGFEIIAINVKQSKSISEDFRKNYKADFQMIADEKGEIAATYQIDELPANYFIDTQGRIYRRIVGWVDEQQVRVVINQSQSK